MLLGKEFALGRKNILEKLGFGLSILCAIHCMLTPLFVAFLPLVSSNLFHNHTVEYILLGSSFLIVGYTNFMGFKNHHKNRYPILLMILAFLFILVGHITHSHTLEIICSVIGGLLLAYSVFVNQQQKKIARNKS